MYYVSTVRVIKLNTGNTGAQDKFTPRTVNRESIRVSGPWAERNSAEQAALAALATHTCLSAVVLTTEDMQAAIVRMRSNGTSYSDSYNAMRDALQLVQETVPE